ncbi:MAG: hypothetical protein WC819_04400 [Parcubacteria group bacterium]
MCFCEFGLANNPPDRLYAIAFGTFFSDPHATISTKDPTFSPVIAFQWYATLTTKLPVFVFVHAFI